VGNISSRCISSTGSSSNGSGSGQGSPSVVDDLPYLLPLLVGQVREQYPELDLEVAARGAEG